MTEIIFQLRGAKRLYLPLRKFRGRHGGDEQADAFLKVIEEYEHPAEKIGFFTIENDGFDDLMLNLISPPIRPTER